MPTPAISVLSAVEGLTIVNSALEALVLPIAIAIIIGLFLYQEPPHRAELRDAVERVAAVFVDYPGGFGVAVNGRRRRSIADESSVYQSRQFSALPF